MQSLPVTTAKYLLALAVARRVFPCHVKLWPGMNAVIAPIAQTFSALCFERSSTDRSEQIAQIAKQHADLNADPEHCPSGIEGAHWGQHQVKYVSLRGGERLDREVGNLGRVSCDPRRTGARHNAGPWEHWESDPGSAAANLGSVTLRPGAKNKQPPAQQAGHAAALDAFIDRNTFPSIHFS